MEGIGAFVATTFMVKSDGKHPCQFRPKQSDYCACMAHVSHYMRYGWLLPLLN